MPTSWTRRTALVMITRKILLNFVRCKSLYNNCAIVIFFTYSFNSLNYLFLCYDYMKIKHQVDLFYLLVKLDSVSSSFLKASFCSQTNYKGGKITKYLTHKRKHNFEDQHAKVYDYYINIFEFQIY